MGSCFSKKTPICSSPAAFPDPPDRSNSSPSQVPEKKKEEPEPLKKEIFVIKHRKSHEIDRRSDEEKPKSDQKSISAASASLNSSTTSNYGAADALNITANASNVISGGITVRTSSCTKEEVDAILIQCGRLSRSSSTGKAALSCENKRYSGSKRSYDFDQDTSNSDKDRKNCDDVGDGGDDETLAERIHRHRQRSRQSRPPSSSPSRRRTPSRERDQQRSGSRERASSGGGRRVSRSPGRRSESPIVGNANNMSTNSTNGRPGKMVSVPALDKSNNGGMVVEAPSAAAIKRITVKRNAGGEAQIAARSAASPRRSRSPARVRTAASENQNVQQQPLSLSRSNSRKAEHSPFRRNPLGEIDQNCINAEKVMSQARPNVEKVMQPKAKTATCRAEQQEKEEREEGSQPITGNVPVTVVAEALKPQTITRSRSSRLSRDLDVNPETLLNPNPSSYTALLLEDIQNFHQKSTTPAISLPACVSKACSIVEAVADLNSSSSCNLKAKDKDPLVESEGGSRNDLMEPSFHKYVTVRRGATVGGADLEEQESSGSNSFVSGQQNWGSLWEPNSADSTDRWTSSGIGRGRGGSGRGNLHSIAAAST